ncbi:MAG: Flp pilus assembly complex ATPase component TadA [Phycisphaeraceae bacterium]|nr:Flp pilus assembly complex ATPase component TadA [Phycisphaeraceae bacterium]MCW5763645.1 Flp pilus assembly complex ATPase component TadA [Phycisphaeraceae bacterium]
MTATAAWTAGTARPSETFMRLIDHEFARRHLVLSAGCREGVELLLASAQTRPAAIFNIGVRLGCAVDVRTCPAEDLAIAIDRAYAAERSEEREAEEAIVIEGGEDVAGDLDLAVRDAERDLLSTHGKAPAVRLVDLVLFEALVRGASDVHLQPLRDRTLVRYRLNGSLHTMRELPSSVAASVVSRIKVMAGLDVAERRAPQDGRASVSIGRAGGRHASAAGRQADLRISTLPSVYGERVVLRLLDPARSPHLSSFASLGMTDDLERAYLAQIARTSGIVLSTGPTGSGKTTTLYASLAWISATNAGGSMRGCELNMVTVEDPVEYDLSGAGLAISQTQVDPKKNVTFATGLRHILRQDPDVIMVGEIRDEETARIAVQASLTGHLVLSTLHTSDSASAIARLLDLGVEPFLVSSSLCAVLAQRLVRTVHGACDGRGCEACLMTGFEGRTGLFELLVLDTALRSMISNRAPANEILALARSRGMRTLHEHGLSLVASGVSTQAELSRVIDASEELET